MRKITTLTENILAITLVEKALSEEVSLSPDERIAARELLGLSSYLAKDSDKARAAFTDLLLQAPKHVLDPFSVAPPIIEFFEAIRKELEPQLKALTQAEPTPQPEQEPVPRGERSQIIERIVVERSP